MYWDSLNPDHSSLVAVGIFVNQDPNRIREIMGIYKLDLAQLASDEHPGDLAAVVRTVGLWGLDVVSGVESSPGVNDLVKILAFISTVRSGKSK